MNTTTTAAGTKIDNAITEDAIRELCTLCTRDEAGRHFTDWSKHWEALEAAGLIEVGRPVHGATGLPYSQDEWSLVVTDDGIAIVEANPELHPAA